MFSTVAPTWNDLTVSRPAVLRAGSVVKITCETDSSNPPVHIRWNTRRWANFTAMVEAPRSSPMQYTSRAQYHGTRTTSVLSLTLQDEDIGQNVSCGVYWNDTEVAQELSRNYMITSECLHHYTIISSMLKSSHRWYISFSNIVVQCWEQWCIVASNSMYIVISDSSTPPSKKGETCTLTVLSLLLKCRTI